VQIRLQRINSHVEITVADTGEGIAPAFLPQLFQRFTQGDGSYTRTHSGLGLGLAISRHLVEAHGGVIEAFSPGKGQGTTIRIELPLMIIHDDKVGADDRVHPGGDGEITPRGAMTDLSGLRVLLVDDDLDALSMARDALTLSGAEVVTAHGAIEALETLDGERFDAAVFDIGMPETDGYELLKRLREREAGRRGYLPALALTAYARSVDRTRSLQAGFQMHLTKPVRPAELAAAVASLAKLSAS
jgi:CheY-like chemotaxis protein